MWQQRRILGFRKPFRHFLVKTSGIKQYAVNNNWFGVSNTYVNNFRFFSFKNACLTIKNLEAFRRVLIRKVTRVIAKRFLFSLHIAVTSKPKEVRMGGVKGNFSYWTGAAHAGRSILRLSFRHCYSIPKCRGIFLRSLKKLGSSWFFPRC